MDELATCRYALDQLTQFLNLAAQGLQLSGRLVMGAKMVIFILIVITMFMVAMLVFVVAMFMPIFSPVIAFPMFVVGFLHP